MKLTPETLSSKLGKKVDINTIDELSLPGQGFSEVSSFLRLKALKTLDLSGNRFQLIRHIKGLFDLPSITELDLSGNPVAKVNNYRLTVIHYLPTLTSLDQKPVTDLEREKARSFDPNATKDQSVKDPLSSPSKEEATQEEEEVADQPEKKFDGKLNQAAPVEEISSKLDEDDLFGPVKTKSFEFEKDEEISLDSINISGLEKKPTPAKKVSTLTFEEDDDIFASTSKKPTSSAKSTSSFLDDDLFSMTKEEKDKSTLSSEFNISSYINSQKSRSKGGLFD
eukprot:gene1159-1469_t